MTDAEFFIARLRAHQWWAIMRATFGVIGMYERFPQLRAYQETLKLRVDVPD